MKLEIAHDFIAKKVYEEASIDDKNRARAMKYLQEKYTTYQTDNNFLLNQSDLAYIKPHLKHVLLEKEKTAYIATSESIIKRQRRNSRLKKYGVVILITAFFFLAWIFEEQQAFNQVRSQLSYAQDSIQILMRTSDPQPILDIKSSSFSPIKITGHVQNEKTQDLAACIVEVLGVSIPTQIDGSFEFYLVLSPLDMEKEVTISFSKLGYTTTYQSLDIDLQELDFDITLRK